MCPEDMINALNFCATDGERLVATRYRNHPTERPATLYLSTTAGATLDRRYLDNKARPDGSLHAAHVIIASETITKNPEDWELLEKNQMICVGIDHILHRQSIPC